MSTVKSFEKKAAYCASTKQFIRIVPKKSGEDGYLSDGRMTLSSKTFENNSDYIFLLSARLAGTEAHIREFLSNESSVLSEKYVELVELDLKQALTKDNYKSESVVQEYQLVTTGTPSFHKSIKSQFNQVYERELSYLKDQKKKKVVTEFSDLTWTDLAAIIYNIKNVPRSIEITDKPAMSKLPTAKPPKVLVNKLIEKNSKAAEAGKWLDVSKCLSDGAGIIAHNDKSDGAYVFIGYPHLSRFFFTLKKDVGMTSPHKGRKNMGPAYCLHYYHSHTPGSHPKSLEECVDEVGDMIKKQRP